MTSKKMKYCNALSSFKSCYRTKKIDILVLFYIIFVLWPIKTSSALSCPHICGNTSIRYPFGIGENCYLDKGFEVTCRNSSGSPKAFLSSIDLELLESDDDYISDGVSVNVSIPVIPLNSSSKASISQGANLSGSPFSFSNMDNVFIAIGCNYRYASHNDTTDAWCLSICTCDPTQNDGCYDIICKIPPHLKVDSVSKLDIYSEINLPQHHGSAFLVDRSLLGSYLQFPNFWENKKYVPAILEWGQNIGECVELYNSGATVCNEDDFCLIQLSSGHTCLCDEPRSEIYRGCRGKLYCNMTSGHSCSECPSGYIYDQQQQSCSSYRSYDKIFIKKSRLKVFLIIGCSAALGTLLLLMAIWWLYKFIKRKKQIKLKQKFFMRNGGLILQQHMSSKEGRNIKKTNLFTSEELQKATDNYNTNRILGQGGQGTVYKGMLAAGRIVAVKKSKIVDESKLEEFINEVVILSQINHRNVVQLLGCCLETEVPLLVYEFIPNGNLYQHINDPSEDFPITWELRLSIALEVSSALSYLHSAASVPIYHRDIKSTNILLDEKYRAKVSDFGTSRSIDVDQTHLTTKVYGTFGYFDPEYFRSSQFTEKSDVYSFGVVLAELLTGQKPIRSTDCEEDKSLIVYFLSAVKENRLFEILDTQVLKEGGKEEIVRVANLTKRCLKLNGKKRPTMREVVTELSGIKAMSGALIMQQNYEEIGSANGNITSHFENFSIDD